MTMVTLGLESAFPENTATRLREAEKNACCEKRFACLSTTFPSVSISCWFLGRHPIVTYRIFAGHWCDWQKKRLANSRAGHEPAAVDCSVARRFDRGRCTRLSKTSEPTSGPDLSLSPDLQPVLPACCQKIRSRRRSGKDGQKNLPMPSVAPRRY